MAELNWGLEKRQGIWVGLYQTQKTRGLPAQNLGPNYSSWILFQRLSDPAGGEPGSPESSYSQVKFLDLSVLWARRFLLSDQARELGGFEGFLVDFPRP